MGRSKAKSRSRAAIRLDQGTGRSLYLLSLTGRELLEIADVSRISRNNAGKLLGYQRPEVKRHVKNIIEYLNTDSVLFPNPIILAFPESVKFKASRGQTNGGVGVPGILEIPLPNGNGRRPAWVVDGQQRILAISKSKRLDMPIPVSVFLSDDVEMQRDQFLRLNSSKPLPRGLITELLPEISTLLPSNLAARKIPSALCDVLNADPESPFFGLVKRPSTPAALRKQAVVTDTSVIQMVEESISSPSGCLFPYRNLSTGETDFDGIRALLFTYWQAVKETFPEAWGKLPLKSRLMHGAGIKAMGRLMDKMMGTAPPSWGDRKGVRKVKKELALISQDCHWTSGHWSELDGLPWNGIQNVPRHVKVLSNHLVRSYLRAKGWK